MPIKPSKKSTLPKPIGRPPLPEDERLIQRSIRMTAAQWAKVDQFGIEWMRTLVTRARPK